MNEPVTRRSDDPNEVWRQIVELSTLAANDMATEDQLHEAKNLLDQFEEGLGPPDIFKDQPAAFFAYLMSGLYWHLDLTLENLPGPADDEVEPEEFEAFEEFEEEEVD